MKILIADDDSVSRLLLQRTLEGAADYEVTAVENGRLALEVLCRSDGPRLALLDWEMPELDGPAVCRAVRERSGHAYLYMLLLTAKESKEDMIAGLESGADDYLIKPFDVAELKARLRTGVRILDLEDRLVVARENMRFQATHDSLTSLWNRGVAMDLLARELARSHREQSSTAIMLCDLDHFKNVNDTYGHLVGDQVLRMAAKRLVDSVRPYDFVGRYGGEEFIIGLINCNPASALDRALAIQKSISGRAFDTTSGPLNLTMSAGLLISKEWGLKPVEELLSETDVALYAAKAAGRNCVRMAKTNAVAALPVPVSAGPLSSSR